LGVWNHDTNNNPPGTIPGPNLGQGAFWHRLFDDYAEAGTFTYKVQVYPQFAFGYNGFAPRLRIEFNKF